ncbi:MAG: twitch domain-containing radical SAM protein, partial [Bdellovibrionales bacterium]|nr:twitch domain-containing radical SAM protein [Bdellovibrionales bacterium]
MGDRGPEPGLPAAFCIFPWVEQSFDIHGNLHLCNRSTAVLDAGGRPIALKNPGDLANIWNGPNMRSMRRQMLTGELPVICGRCISMEREGRESKRQEYLSNLPPWSPAPRDMIAATEDDGSTPLHPVSFELRTSNLCNAKCVTCSPEFSTSLIGDHRKLKSEAPESHRLARKIYQKVAHPKDNWAVSAGVYDDLKTNMDRVRLLYFSGGEPLMIPPNTDLVDYCIDSGHAENVSLVYDTNALPISEEWLRRWDHFERVEIRISIDGLGDKFDYIRFPGPFQTFERAAKLLADWNNPKARVTSQTTVSLLNILDLVDIFKWYWSVFGRESVIEKRLFFKDLRDPEALSLLKIPDVVYVEAISKLEGLARDLRQEL